MVVDMFAPLLVGIIVTLDVVAAISNDTSSAEAQLVCPNTAEGTVPCVDSIDTFWNNSDSKAVNTMALLNAFYPSNRAESNVVDVSYCITCDDPSVAINSLVVDNSDGSGDAAGDGEELVTNITCLEEYQFQWLDDSFLVPVDYELLRALTFGAADLNRQSARLFLKPFCGSTDPLQLLRQLTSILKTFARPTSTLDGADFIRGYAILKEVNRVSVQSESKVADYKIYLLVTCLALSSIVCCVVLHCGRVRGSIVYNKLSTLSSSTMESYCKVVDSISILSTAVREKIKKTAKLSEEMKSIINESSETSNNDNVPNHVLLLKIQQEAESNLFPNPLLYISQSTLHWCVIVFIGITIVDVINTSRIRGGTISRREWLLFPMPFWAIAVFLVNFILTIVIQLVIGCVNERPKSCSFRGIVKLFEDVYHVLAVFCVTSLPLYLIFHGVWLAVIAVTFPIRTIPAIVFVLFLISGVKWLVNNIKVLLSIADDMYDIHNGRNYGGKIGKMRSFYKAIDNKFPSPNKTLPSAMVAESAHKILKQTAQQVDKVYLLRTFFGYIILQLTTLVIWGLAQASVYVFSDVIQNTSDLSDNPITTIIGAIVASKVFADVMKLLTPQISQHSNVTILDCQITAVIVITVKERQCEVCDGILVPSDTNVSAMSGAAVSGGGGGEGVSEGEGGEEGVSEGGEGGAAVVVPCMYDDGKVSCPQCSQVQTLIPLTELTQATVHIKGSDDNVATVILTHQFIDTVLHNTNTIHCDTSNDVLKQHLILAEPFDMTLNKHEVIAIKRAVKEEAVDQSGNVDNDAYTAVDVEDQIYEDVEHYTQAD